MRSPAYLHWLVALRADIVDQTEADKRTCVAKPVLLVLAHEEQKLLSVLLLSYIAPTPAGVCVGVFRLPMKLVFADNIIVIHRLGRKIFVRFVKSYKE